MLSNNSSILNSGAGVVISDLETGEDLPKWEQVINTPEFECYLGDKYSGLTLIFGILHFMTDFFPKAIEFFQNNFVFNLEQVFSIYYNKCYIYYIIYITIY